MYGRDFWHMHKILVVLVALLPPLMINHVLECFVSPIFTKSGDFCDILCVYAACLTYNVKYTCLLPPHARKLTCSKCGVRQIGKRFVEIKERWKRDRVQL